MEDRFRTGGGAKFPQNGSHLEFHSVLGDRQAPRNSLLPSPAEIIWSTSRSRGVSGSGSSGTGEENAAGAGRTSLNPKDARRSAQPQRLRERRGVVRSSVTGQDGAHSGAKRFKEPIRLWLLRQHDDGVLLGDFGVFKRIQQAFLSVRGGFHQNNIKAPRRGASRRWIQYPRRFLQCRSGYPPTCSAGPRESAAKLRR